MPIYKHQSTCPTSTSLSNFPQSFDNEAGSFPVLSMVLYTCTRDISRKKIKTFRFGRVKVTGLVHTITLAYTRGLIAWPVMEVTSYAKAQFESRPVTTQHFHAV